MQILTELSGETMKGRYVVPSILSGWAITSITVAALICLPALPAAAAEGSFQRNLRVTGPVHLDLSTGSGSVEVHAGNSSQVQVTGHIRASEWFGTNVEEKIKRLETNPPIQQSGNDIRIGHIDDPELRHNISISYEVVVPAETDLRVQSGSGDQRVEGIRGPLEVSSGSGGLKISAIGDRVHAETGSGDIDINRVKGNVHAKTGSGSIDASDIAGAFEANTGSGHIILQQTAPGSVRVDTGSGGMELHGVDGSLEAKAGSGTIQAEGSPTGAWTVHTGSGEVNLKLPSNAAFDLDAHTSSGSISVDQPHTVQGSVGRKEVRGRVGGGGVPVEVETGSGDIQIR
jgi:putative adhesin